MIKIKVTAQIALGALLLIGWLMFATTPAYSTDWDECDHPRFLEKGCGYEGEDGADGADGADGQDGADGRDGVDGKDGRDGIDGIDGKDGEIPTEWITEVRTNHITVRDWWEEARYAAAAQAAMDAYLPQYSNQRLHFNAAHVQGKTGSGFGYAYMLDNERNAGLTFSMGFAGSETAARASFGFEFGGDRPMRVDMSHLASEPEVVVYEPPPGAVTIEEDEYNALVAQAVQKEEFEEAVERGEYRYAQQQSLIEELQEQVAEHEDDDEKLERLKQEAAALRAAQEAEEIKQADIRAQFKRRYDARSNEGDDEGKDQ